MNEKQLAYLRAIDQHSGEWTWYQLDRSLSAQNVRFVDGMIEFLLELEKAGLVEIERKQEFDYYSITAKGKQVLAAAAPH